MLLVVVSKLFRALEVTRSNWHFTLELLADKFLLFVMRVFTQMVRIR